MRRKKELKQEYKNMKSEMGVFIIKNNLNGKSFIDRSLNVKSTLNRFKFELKMGNNRIKDLQKDWNQYGKDNFTMKVLEYIEYDEKEEQKDFSEKLEIAKMLWLDKLNEDEKLLLY